MTTRTQRDLRCHCCDVELRNVLSEKETDVLLRTWSDNELRSLAAEFVYLRGRTA